MTETALAWGTTYGYTALFVLLMLGIAGLPVPDETLLTFTGYLIFKGTLNGYSAVATAFLGSACGITLSYVLGRWTLLIGYYIPGVRHFTAYVAGASWLEFPVFALFAYSGALLWSLSFITLGYCLGEQWSRLSDQLHSYL